MGNRCCCWLCCFCLFCLSPPLNVFVVTVRDRCFRSLACFEEVVLCVTERSPENRRASIAVSLILSTRGNRPCTPVYVSERDRGCQERMVCLSFMCIYAVPTVEWLVCNGYELGRAKHEWFVEQSCRRAGRRVTTATATVSTATSTISNVAGEQPLDSRNEVSTPLACYL